MGWVLVAFLLLVLILVIAGKVIQSTRGEQPQSTETPAAVGMETEVPVPAGGTCSLPSCRDYAAASTRVAPADAPVMGHLGVLYPTTGLLEAGTTQVRLSLATEQAANCRWSLAKDTLFALMPYQFNEGQRTQTHGTLVTGLKDLEDVNIYVRCQELSPPSNPDAVEWHTHLRVMGAPASRYPRIANLWGFYDPSLGEAFFSQLGLFIPYQWKEPQPAIDLIRRANPGTVILLNQDLTHGRPDSDELAAEWQASKKGEAGYACLLRSSHGDILLTPHWKHPMFNLTDGYCRDALVARNVKAFLSDEKNLAYDGIYWDLLFGEISWLGEDIDSDLDGQPDDAAWLDSRYQAGVSEMLRQVRAALPNAILAGNEAVIGYGQWIDGRLFEWQLSSLMDGADWFTWNEVIVDYRRWTVPSRTGMTIIESAPEALFAGKFQQSPSGRLNAAMEAEAAASYQRMRFGLASTLMGDGLFSFDFGPEYHGQLWWYDEYGSVKADSALPLPGYLGKPGGEPFLLEDMLNSPDLIRNGGFEEKLVDWSLDLSPAARGKLSVEEARREGEAPSHVAHIHMAAAEKTWDAVLSQKLTGIPAPETVTISFWGRSDSRRAVMVRVGELEGAECFSAPLELTPAWQHFHFSGSWKCQTHQADLQFYLGTGAGDIWLDEVQFQEGSLGVWGRRFENGLAVVNTSPELHIVNLPGTYCRLNGSQAPRFTARVDDDQAQFSAGWNMAEAGKDQFGLTIHQSRGTPAAAATYTPDLAYAGKYEVWAWVSPQTGQSADTHVTIRHANGESMVRLDESSGETGWRSLGVYTFAAGAVGSAELQAGKDGLTVADAFKWESRARYNDGDRTGQITLQPMDGIILLNTCYFPKP